jgi:hypothetical protein
MQEEKINVASSWEAAMIDDFQEGIATPEETVTPTETVEQTIETPVAEAPENITEIVIPEAVEDPIVETVVEKFIETPKPELPELNEDAKRIYEALAEGKEEEVLKYLSERRKDYSVMSDFDVVKEGLRKEHPDWTDKRLDLEFKTKYNIPTKKDLSEIDADVYPDEYEKAVSYNDTVLEKENLLALQAEEYRIKLESNKSKIEFPKITDNIQSTEPTPEQIAESIEQWQNQVVSEVPKINDFKYRVNGEDVVYKITPDEKTALTETMKEFNTGEYLTKRGWFDQEGNPNILRITEDVYRLENEGKMIGSVATQIKTATRKEVISKDIKNIDHEDKSTANVNVQKPFWQVAMEAGE